MERLFGERLFGLGSLVFRAWVLVVLVFLSGLMFPGGVAAVAGVPVGACLRFFLLYAAHTLPCLVFLPIIWKNSSRVAAGVLFLLKKTNKEKKTRKRVKIFIKSVDTDTGAC